MAARGSIAKVEVENKIKEAFGSDFAGVADKKIYVWADDGGERVQIAISMTCPKVYLGEFADAGPTIAATGGGIDFEAQVPQKAAEVTQEELDRISEMMNKLGL